MNSEKQQEIRWGHRKTKNQKKNQAPKGVGCHLWKELQSTREKLKVRKRTKLAKTRTCANILECYKIR